MEWVFIVVVVLAGAMAPTQAGINAELSSYLRSNVLAALVSFLVGSGALFVYALVLRLPWPGVQALQAAPWWVWTGGLCGAYLVTATVTAVPVLGAATMIGVFVAGQMGTSLVLDHFGWVGYPVQPISVWRCVGIVCILVGVFLIKRF